MEKSKEFELYNNSDLIQTRLENSFFPLGKILRKIKIGSVTLGFKLQENRTSSLQHAYRTVNGTVCTVLNKNMSGLENCASTAVE